MTGLEPLALNFVQEAAKSLAGVVTKSAWETGGGFLNSTKQMIFNASKKYVENYAQRHGIIKVLGMREPVELENIYTEVQFLGEEGSQQFISIDKLEQAYRQSSKRRFQLEKGQRRDGLKVANEQQYLMVLGQPGAGKSTFLRRIGLEALKGRKGKYQLESVPVFLELKRFNTGNINLEKAITEELKNCGFPKPEDSTKKLLEKGKLLVLLDGLDEIPTTQLFEAIQQIQDFVDLYSQNRFIGSCRTAAYRSRFTRFVDVVMADFSVRQIQQFINNWFQGEEDKQQGIAQRCWELLNKPESAAAFELAQTPLLLTLLCLVFDDSQSFPKNRAVLYDEALDVLLKKWAAEKRVQRDPIYQDLSVPLEKMMLAEIAHKGFVEDRLFFSQNDVIDQIRNFLASNLNAPKHLDGEAILEAIQIQQGILVERAKDVLSFSHLTLQEYLTAQYIADNNLVEQLVSTYLTDRRRREVFLLVAGLMRSGTDPLLEQMQKKAQKYINTQKLQNLLQWAERETVDSALNLKPVGKRALAMIFAKAIAEAIAEANANANAEPEPEANVYAEAYQYAEYEINAIGNAIGNAIAIAEASANAIGNAIGNAIAIVIANAKAIANANANANAKAIANAKAYVIGYVYAEAKAIAFAIEVIIQLGTLQIFKNINLTSVPAQLETLQTQIPNEKQPLEDRRLFATLLQQTMLSALNLTKEMVDLSEEELKALDNYFYANYLMIQCKEAAVRVSRETWEAIEERMLLPDV